MEVTVADAATSSIDRDDLFEKFQRSEGKLNGRVYSYAQAVEASSSRDLNAKMDFLRYNHHTSITNWMMRWTCHETETSASISIGGNADGNGNSSGYVDIQGGVSHTSDSGTTCGIEVEGRGSVDNQGNTNASGQITLSIKG